MVDLDGLEIVVELRVIFGTGAESVSWGLMMWYSASWSCTAAASADVAVGYVRAISMIGPL